MAGVFRHRFIPPPRPSFIIYGSPSDTTAPSLSSPLGVVSGATTATGYVDTNEANGTLYWVVTQSATPPSVAQVQAGQNHLGAAADDSGNQAVTTTGTQTVSSTGLTTGVTYYFHFQQQDTATNDSTVVTSAGFVPAFLFAGQSTNNVFLFLEEF